MDPVPALEFATFKDVDAVKGAPFIIAQPEKVVYSPQSAVLKAGESKMVLEVYLSDGCKIASTKEQRKAVEASANIDWLTGQLDKLYSGKAYSVELVSPASNLRWAAGGVLPMDTSGNVLALFRDAGAPSYKLHFTLASGLSETSGEILNPTVVMLREGIEEMAYATKAGTLVVPVVRNMGAQYSSAFSYQMVSNALNLIGEKAAPFAFIDAEISKNAGGIVKVFYKGEQVSESYGIINIDPKTAGIDVLGVMKMDIDFTKIVPFDTEVGNRAKPRETRLDREIHLINAQDVRKLVEGGSMTTSAFKGRMALGPRSVEAKATPVLIEVAKAIAGRA